jgi:hypothetical protein
MGSIGFIDLIVGEYKIRPYRRGASFVPGPAASDSTHLGFASATQKERRAAVVGHRLRDPNSPAMISGRTIRQHMR